MTCTLWMLLLQMMINPWMLSHFARLHRRRQVTLCLRTSAEDVQTDLCATSTSSWKRPLCGSTPGSIRHLCQHLPSSHRPHRLVEEVGWRGLMSLERVLVAQQLAAISRW